MRGRDGGGEGGRGGRPSPPRCEPGPRGRLPGRRRVPPDDPLRPPLAGRLGWRRLNSNSNPRERVSTQNHRLQIMVAGASPPTTPATAARRPTRMGCRSAESKRCNQNLCYRVQQNSLLQAATEISVAGCNQNLCCRVQPKSLLQSAESKPGNRSLSPSHRNAATAPSLSRSLRPPLAGDVSPTGSVSTASFGTRRISGVGPPPAGDASVTALEDRDRPLPKDPARSPSRAGPGPVAGA